MFGSERKTYYEILEVNYDASPGDIRQAYLRAKVAYGRDSSAMYSLFDQSESKAILDQIEQAYLVLSNPEQRRQYDKNHGIALQPVAPSAFGTTPSYQAPSGIFSFAQEKTLANRHLSPADRASQQAAATVLGLGDTGLFSSSSSSSAPPQAPATSPRLAETASLNREEALRAQSIAPRSLEESTKMVDAMETSPQRKDPASPPAFVESKLGPIRRHELVPSPDRNSPLEQEIAAEAQFRGAFFRTVRERRGIQLDELCEYTKISKAYLSAIETEAFESLPAAPYVRGFVAQVSKALRIPSEKATAAFMKNYYSAQSGKA